MTVYGYARVSTSEQHLDLQIPALKKAGAEAIFSEKISGRSAARPELIRLLETIKRGDTIMVTRLDRISRSMSDLCKIVSTLTERGCDFRVLYQSGLDTNTATGRLMVHILGAIAEFENDLRAERQKEGIRRAQAEGKYIGRPRQTQLAEARRLRTKGHTAIEIANQLNISVRSVYRLTRGLWRDEPTALKDARAA